MYLFVDGFHKFCEIFLFFNCEIHSVHLRAFFNFYFHLLHRTYKLLKFIKYQTDKDPLTQIGIECPMLSFLMWDQ